MACMKLKALEQNLQELDDFNNPKVKLEQYATSPHMAAMILHTIQSCYGDIEGKMVGDLGCGCGVLSIGAAYLGAAHSVGFDIDSDALSVFTSNIFESEINNIDAIQCDVCSLHEFWNGKFDTVVMNPPFGTKEDPGVDVKFLEVAMKISRKAVYSLHKTSTRTFILQKGRALGATCKVVAELLFELPATYKFHKKHSVDINVDLVQFCLKD